MAENGLSERFDRIEQKLDKQFSEVQEHFVEQRKYLEFVYEQLAKRISRMERTLDRIIDVKSRPPSTIRRRARPSKRRR